MKKIKNPLVKRIPREILGDWRKYLVVSLFLILTIGFVSGMYVANGSMMTAAEEGVTRYKLEDGHFELDQKADEELLSSIESGEQANVWQYYVRKARKEFDEEFPEEFKKEFDKEFEKEYKTEFDKSFAEMGADADEYDSLYQKYRERAYKSAYKEAYKEAYDEAWIDVIKEIEEKYEDASEKYDLKKNISLVPVNVYENFYRNESEGSDGTIRVFSKTEDVNLACVMEGRLPETKEEIAIDRMHANNAGIKTGDTIDVGGQSYQVTGLIAYVNYATLHEKNSDMMFDALKFDVAMVTEDGFDRLSGKIHYNYAWNYQYPPKDTQGEKKLSDSFLQVLLTQTVTEDLKIEDYIPRYANSAVNFATEDMGSDMAMGGVLLYILIGIIAFIFAITSANTISREASAIGTLRASGYTIEELTIHYLSMPMIVTFVSAIVGNVLGYTVFVHTVTSMYYNSYSLPTYQTVWSGLAFVRTTLIPVILMFVINLAVILRVMQLSPLKFLRHDLKKQRKKKAMRLPRWRFFARFRLRIIFQNLPNYLILFVGVFFVAVMLAMSVGMPATLKHYQDHVSEMMFADYQYVLNGYEDEDGNLITTENANAEKFDLCTLVRKGSAMDEEISVYGVEKNSRYVDISEFDHMKEGEVFVSSTYSEKYQLSVGDKFTLDEKYEDNQYTFTVAGIYDRGLSMAVFLPIQHYESIFNLKKNEFTGFLSDEKIDDIDEDRIATVITQREITKMADQLDHSMGAYMTYFQYLCILLSAVLIYLLTKIIIEKNETAISMIKILGFEDREIFRLYLLSTTIVVILADLVSTVLGVIAMRVVWRQMLARMSGYFIFVMTPADYVKMFLFVFLGYLIVLVFDFKRIRKISLSEALKNME